MSKLLAYLWAAPATAVGLLLALIAVCGGAHARIVQGVVEVGGGILAALPRTTFGVLHFDAITFGHIVLGRTHAVLDSVRAHEHVHVRQYERWGVLFFALYVASSAWQMLRGRDPYRQNHFEVEAFGGQAPASQSSDSQSPERVAQRNDDAARGVYLLALLFVVLAGLASRKYPALLPAALGKYPGDALWTVMLFVLWRLVSPRANRLIIAALALGTSYAVELSQLYHAPWIDAARATTLGHLALGSYFAWGDLAAYTSGALLALAADTLLRQPKSR